MLLWTAVFNLCFGYCYGYYADGKAERRRKGAWVLREELWWVKLVVDCLLLGLPILVVAYVYERVRLGEGWVVYLGMCLVYGAIGYVQVRWSPLLEGDQGGDGEREGMEERERNPLSYDVE